MVEAARPRTEPEPVRVELLREAGYRFRVDVQQEGVAPFVVDEPPPLGQGAGPDATGLLAAAVGQCLSASLLFCLERARVPVQGLATSVHAALGRNPAGRLRVVGIAVELRPEVAADDWPRAARCLAVFEDFCVVTASVRGGVPVEVRVQPPGAV